VVTFINWIINLTGYLKLTGIDIIVSILKERKRGRERDVIMICFKDILIFTIRLSFFWTRERERDVIMCQGIFQNDLIVSTSYSRKICVRCDYIRQRLFP
jgi:hypothetical protein